MEENFYIGYAVDKLDEKRIKDGKIECISKMYGDFKCATLHTVEPEDKIDYTESFNRVGYEIEPYSNTTRNFSFNDAGTIDGLEDNIYAVNKFNKEGYNKNYYTHCNMYVFKDPNKTVEIMNNKKQNRIKTLSKFGEKMKNLNDKKQRLKKKHKKDDNFKQKIGYQKQTAKQKKKIKKNTFEEKERKIKKSFFDLSNKQRDNSFDKNNYTLTSNKAKTIFYVKEKANQGDAKDNIILKLNIEDGKIIEKMNEINFLKNDQEDKQLYCERIFVYEDYLNENKQNNKLDENKNIYNIQTKNFPNETIRVINKETQKYNLITAKEFYDKYCTK